MDYTIATVVLIELFYIAALVLIKKLVLPNFGIKIKYDERDEVVSSDVISVAFGVMGMIMLISLAVMSSLEVVILPQLLILHTLSCSLFITISVFAARFIK